MVGGLHGRGHVWWGGGVRGKGTCVAGSVHDRGVCVAVGGGGWGIPRQILRDTVNERVVRILLECILVIYIFRQL